MGETVEIAATEAPEALAAAEKTRKRKRKTRRALARLAAKLAFFAGLTWATFTFVLGWTRASENNMYPMVKAGDFCLYYRLGGAYVGDAVAYRGDDGKTRLARVAAIGGQTVTFPEEGGYEVNGAIPSETLPYETRLPESGAAKFPLELGEDERFLLNDYRSDASDGRTFGATKVDEIEGKLIFVLRRRSI